MQLVTPLLRKVMDTLYVRQMSSPVIENWHEDFIVNLAGVIRPKVYVELGLYQSQLFNRIIPFADRLIGVDTVEKAGTYIKSSPKVEFFHGTTDEFANRLKKQPITIDMLFIDADHSKESVKRDFENFFPFVAAQGIIVFHDAHPKDKKHIDAGYCGDGYLAIEELARNTKDYEITTIPVHPGVAICRKRTTQLKWQEKQK